MTKQDIKDTKMTSEASLDTNFISMTDLELVAPTKDMSHSYALWIRALLQNWRQGTVGSQTRSQVSLSTRKPWKQKGTGRARAGTARSPLWRGGGVIFGPQARTRTLKVTKRTKYEVMRALLATYAENNKIMTVDLQLKDGKPSTKAGFLAMGSINATNKKVSLFLKRDDYANWLSLRNLPNIQILSFDALNAYDLSNSDCLVVLKKDFSNFKDMVAKWN